jgi:hypothetical protein
VTASCSSRVLSHLRRALGRAFRRRLTPDARIVSHVVALDALGWRVVELRPSSIDGEVTLWRVTAERLDRDASMHMAAEEPDVALAELVRYASADAPGER